VRRICPRPSTTHSGLSLDTPCRHPFGRARTDIPTHLWCPEGGGEEPPAIADVKGPGPVPSGYVRIVFRATR
jgi:hypothetical protein